jgi:hypothetical protein
MNLKKSKRIFCPLNLLIAIRASFKLCNAITWKLVKKRMQQTCSMLTQFLVFFPGSPVVQQFPQLLFSMPFCDW